MDLLEDYQALVEEYLGDKDIKSKTKKDYRVALCDFETFLKEKNLNLKSIKRKDIIAYKDEMISSRHLKAPTVAKYLCVIRGLFAYIDANELGHNVAGDIKNPSIKKTFARSPLSVKEVHKLLAVASKEAHKSLANLRDYAIIFLLVTTGLRTIEIERANIEDLITTNSGIHKLMIQRKFADGKDTFIKVSDEVYKLISLYLSKRDDNHPALFLSHSKNQHERIRTISIRRAVKNLLVLAGIDVKKYSAHSLRHTAATIALEQGFTLQEIKELLGHSQITTTEIYAHIKTREDSKIEEKLSEIYIKNPRES